MAPPLDKLPDTPEAGIRAAANGLSRAWAPKKATGPATASKLHQELRENIASSPLLVTETDFTSVSPLAGKGTYVINNSSIGPKRHDSMARVIEKDRRSYDVKMKMFGECAAAVDKTLQKASTELYRDAKDFGAFFASCLDTWLNKTGPADNAYKSMESTKTFAQVAAPKVSKNPPMCNVGVKTTQ